MSAALALVDSASASGHNTLACFHAGCRCGYCASASLERYCRCAPCGRLRDRVFFRPPDPLPKWWR